jgi:HAD superfamily hydrolase (TIGR01509 family)
MGYKFVFFDVDGTLVDSGDALCRSFVRVMSEETGRNVAPEEYARYWGIPAADAFRDQGIHDETRIALACEKWVRYFQEIQKWSPPFPGIEALLEELRRRGCVLGVVTSKNGSELDRNFGPSPLARYLPYRVTADDVANPKPAPDPLLEMLRRAGAENRKEECLYVGDTVFDMQCAAAAGVDFALAAWGLLFGEPEGVQAVRNLVRPGDLLDLIESTGPARSGSRKKEPTASS